MPARVQHDLSPAVDPAFDTIAAAAYLGLAPTTLEIWRTTGRYGLPFEKVGRMVRYRKSALDAFVLSRTFRSTGEYGTVA